LGYEVLVAEVAKIPLNEQGINYSLIIFRVYLCCLLREFKCLLGFPSQKEKGTSVSKILGKFEKLIFLKLFKSMPFQGLWLYPLWDDILREKADAVHLGCDLDDFFELIQWFGIQLNGQAEIQDLHNVHRLLGLCPLMRN
jgi:hypothetical protein